MYQCIKIDDKTWAYQAVMDDGDTVRFFVLNGSEACLVIDSGFFPVNVHELVQKLLEEEEIDKTSKGTAKPIWLANTHGDIDHTGGNASFDAFYMTETDYKNMQISSKCPDSRVLAAEEGTTIDLGDRIIQYYMAPGHTYGNAVLLDVTNRILFPGDMVQTGTMFMFGAHRCPDQLMNSLHKLANMKDQFDQIYACHGQTVLLPDAVDQVIEAWDGVLTGRIQPAKNVIVFGTEVRLYQCGFVNFYCRRIDGHFE